MFPGFLNVDDDEMVQDDDDCMPCDEGADLENSGWSSRTRFVYLMCEAFEKSFLPAASYYTYINLSH